MKVVIAIFLMFITNAMAERPSVEAIKLHRPMSCFRYNNGGKASHKWEKTFKSLSPYWILLAKDDKGFFVAQPRPSCEENSPAQICPFWFRTVEYETNWVADGMIWVPCPEEFSKENLREQMEVFAPGQFKF